MKKHLTAASVERIKPPRQGTIEIFDLGYPGLALRVGHGGAKSFEVFYRTKGKLKRELLGRWPAISLGEARETWRKTREAIAKGEAPAREGTKTSMAALFEFVVEDWLKRDQSRNKPSDQYQVARVVEADLLPAWRGRPIDQITKRDVVALLDSISDRGPSMARRVQSYINRFFGWCVERGHSRSRSHGEHDTRCYPHLAGPCAERCRVKGGVGATHSIGLFGTVTRLLILTGASVKRLRNSAGAKLTATRSGLKARAPRPVNHTTYPISAGTEAAR